MREDISYVMSYLLCTEVVMGPITFVGNYFAVTSQKISKVVFAINNVMGTLFESYLYWISYYHENGYF